jgi:hypothetical protein
MSSVDPGIHGVPGRSRTPVPTERWQLLEQKPIPSVVDSQPTDISRP